jgi:hypothetical protein
MLSLGDTYYFQRHEQVENKKMEKCTLKSNQKSPGKAIVPYKIPMANIRKILYNKFFFEKQKREHFRIIEININIYAFNNRAPKYMKQN